MADQPGRAARVPLAARRRLRVDDCVVVDRTTMRKAQIGAGVGNFIEWYDISIYGYLAITMTEVFTAGMDPRTGLLVTLLGFAVSFVVRPLGGMILGPLGDRIGRRKVLFFTIALMAGGTAAIGVLPTAAQVGAWIVVPLYLLKMLQGFSTGGEFSGATTYIAEFSADRRRGFATSLLNAGAMLGFAAGAGAVALTSVLATAGWGESAMADGGWRIPFLLALPMGALAVAFRSRIPESPGFEAAQKRLADGGAVDPLFVRHDLRGILRRYWPQIATGIALIAADGSANYLLASYLPTYLETQMGVPAARTAVATVGVLVLQAAVIVLAARWSDRIGRRPVYMMAAAGNLVLLIPAFALMHVGAAWALCLALVLVALPSGFFLALTGAVMSELFPTASRYGCVGLTHNIAISVFGGTTPLVSQLLVNLTGDAYAPAYYVMVFSAIALVAAITMRETANRPLLGSAPVVESREEAQALVDGQDANAALDTGTMLLAPEPEPVGERR